MKQFLLFLIVAMCSCSPGNKDIDQPVIKKVLILTETRGYRHASIEDGLALLEKLAQKHDIALVHATSADSLLSESFLSVNLLVLLSCTGNIFQGQKRNALQSFVQKGGRVLGIHAATDVEYDWPWYGEMIGGWFESHPAIQEADCYLSTDAHPTIAGMPQKWSTRDEWYNFQSLALDNQVVVQVDEDSYEGGKHGEIHPISWYREYDGGRIFYTALGHTPETYQDPVFVLHLENAIGWLLN